MAGDRRGGDRSPLFFAVSVLWVTVKRLASNWRIAAAVLAGLLVAVGVMAAVPIYSASSLQQSFVKEWLEKYSFRPPFAVIVTHRNERAARPISYRTLMQLRDMLDRSLSRRIGPPMDPPVVFASLGYNPVTLGTNDPGITSAKAELCQMSNLRELAEIPDGRWFEPRADGVVEAVVDEATFEANELVVGMRFVYWYRLPREGEEPQRYAPMPVEVVGFFRAKSGFTTREWIYPPPYSNRLFVAPEVFTSLLVSAA